jgi:hypothetical protein
MMCATSTPRPRSHAVPRLPADPSWPRVRDPRQNARSDARVTFDLYAQVVTEQQQAAADAMGARFLEPAPRGGRGVEGESDG